jgi:hypothetical protein
MWRSDEGVASLYPGMNRAAQDFYQIGGEDQALGDILTVSDLL